MTWQEWLGAFALGILIVAVLAIGLLLAAGWRA